MQMLKLKHVISGTLEPPYNNKKKKNENIIGFPNTTRLSKNKTTWPKLTQV